MIRRVLQFVLPAAVLGVGVGGAMWLVANAQKAKPKPADKFQPTIRVQKVSLEDYRPIITAQGTARARTEIGLAAEVKGRVTWISPKLVAGGLFDEGDELFRVDAADYQLAREQALADINSAKAASTNALAQVSSARALAAQAEARITREEAEAEAARLEWALLRRQGEPPALLVRVPQIKEAKASLFSANAQANAANAQLHSADAKLKAAEAALELAQLNVDRCSVKAPFDGRVRSQTIGVGQIVSLSAVVARLQPVDVAEVRLALPLEDFGFMDFAGTFGGDFNSTNQPTVRLEPSAGVGGGWTGKVVRSLGEVDDGTRMMAVVGVVRDPYRRLFKANGEMLSFGMFLRAEIDGRELKRVAVLPRDVLRDGDSVHVFVEGKLTSRKVEVTWSTREVLVIAKGLSAGDAVCLTPVDAFVEGMSVRLEEGGGE